MPEKGVQKLADLELNIYIFKSNVVALVQHLCFSWAVVKIFLLGHIVNFAISHVLACVDGKILGFDFSCWSQFYVATFIWRHNSALVFHIYVYVT